MNIGIDAKRIFFNNSGLGNYGRRFYRALAEHSPDDRFYLYTPRTVEDANPHLSSVIPANSRIVSPGRSWDWSPGRALWRSWRINSNLDHDNIRIYYGLSNEIPFGDRKTGNRTVVVIHDLIFLRYPELYPAFDAFFYRRKTYYACLHADFIIAASEQTKRDIVDFYQVPPEKITVIYPASDPSFYREEADDIEEFFNPPSDFMISIGAITPRKNLEKTIRAFDQVKDKTGLDLVVVGTAVGLGRKYLASIRDYIDRRGLNDRIHFLGNVPYKYLPSLCRRATLMVYPSQFEGFGMPIVEGLFSRIPVITSKGSCFPEAGGDGAAYIDPDNVDELAEMMLSLAEPSPLRDEMIEKGLQHNGMKGSAKIMTGYIRYEKLINIPPVFHADEVAS